MKKPEDWVNTRPGLMPILLRRYRHAKNRGAQPSELSYPKSMLWNIRAIRCARRVGLSDLVGVRRQFRLDLDRMAVRSIHCSARRLNALYGLTQLRAQAAGGPRSHGPHASAYVICT